MHLKSLEIQGFKSFPERTLIEFHPGVTAIVGPNGSGKSNVTDAIRWVLGEQSVKTLRGARMEDIIFTGTQSRKAMSFAEVTMTIDNTDQKLPYEYSEIQVTRRLYRSGESEYLLNKTHCRLKDIVSLFMDTGLGRDGYSIVGQGKVDDILSHRSEDRRKIFEEASGIVKFKTRKEEAEKKLQNTDQNLLRINDIIQELSEQMDPLAEQAAAAEKYINLKDELKEIELAYMLDQADQLTNRQHDAQIEKTSLEKDLLKQQDILAAMREENKQASDDIHALDEAIEQQREKINQSNLRANELSGESALSSEKIAQLRERITEGSNIIAESKTALDVLANDISGRQKKLESLQKQKKIYSERLIQAQNDMQELLQTLSKQENELVEWKNQLDRRLEAVYEHRTELGQQKTQYDLISQRIRSIELESGGLSSDRNRLQFQIEDLKEKFVDLNNKFEYTKNELKSAEHEVEQQRLICAELSKVLEQKKQQHRNAEYKLKTLENMEKSHEGYHESVKNIMRLAETDPNLSLGVRGTLGELITVDEKFELAAETALGASVQNIVTDNDRTASRLISWLKQNRAGRATFLPINQIRGRRLERQLENQLEKLPGYLGVGSDIVDGNAEIKEIISSQLGRVVFVDNIDNARQMARAVNFSVRLVTLEGDVMNPGGSMTGGYQRHNSSGLLGRSRDINELSSTIQNLQIKIDNEQKNLETAEHKLHNAGRRSQEISQQVTDLSHQKVRDEAQIASVIEEFERLQGRITVMEQEAQQLREQSSESKTQQKTIEQEIETQQFEIEKLRLAISERESDNKAEQQKRDDMRESITDYKVSLNSVEESLSAMQELSDRIEQERISHQSRIEKQQLTISNCEQEIEQLNTQQDKLQEETENCQIVIKELSAGISDLITQREQLESRQSGYYDQLELATGRMSSIQNEITRAESKYSRLELQLDELKNRLWEEYELTIMQADAWRKTVDNHQEALKVINSLKNRIKNLGAVNLTAIESYASLKERYEFMSNQRNDIEHARQKLNAVISELTEAMREQFISHFHLINENFRRVFSELFGGGMAELNLEDTDDVLSCGIEIKAQPPGKRLQNLTLLSGGERCLTAIALLFAILKLRPTPFCVLDEVEAALDDANVSRFTEYIRNYAEASQFILVTHRKGTMEAADRLYGVTMQERGISRILSMKLSDEIIA
ncbi:MAG: chromosome segregation protein SMC [Eubacteriales bacterium]|nr:chromosome segregation protein SMC [Eubacteriales bacterium]